MSERLPKLGQGPERPRRPHAFTRSVKFEADAPGEPLGARLGPGVGPALQIVELTDKIEQPSAGHLDVGGQLGDLISHTFSFGDLLTRRCRNEHANLLCPDCKS